MTALEAVTKAEKALADKLTLESIPAEYRHLSPLYRPAKVMHVSAHGWGTGWDVPDDGSMTADDWSEL